MSMYECTWCPLCGELMWNGQCENLDCKYHWYPKDNDDDGEDYQGYIIYRTLNRERRKKNGFSQILIALLPAGLDHGDSKAPYQ